MAGPSLTGIPAGYQPAYSSGLTLSFKVTVTNAAQRLVTIIGAANWPTYPDDQWNSSATASNKRRAPNHVLFEVPIAAANPVYLTWDNNTAPVVGGPGLELQPGTVYKFENAWASGLLTDGVNARAGKWPVNALSAFQFIAAANTTLLVTFTD